MGGWAPIRFQRNSVYSFFSQNIFVFDTDRPTLYFKKLATRNKQLNTRALIYIQEYIHTCTHTHKLTQTHTDTPTPTHT